MKFIPNYRVCYSGQFYEAGTQFSITVSYTHLDVYKRQAYTY